MYSPTPGVSVRIPECLKIRMSKHNLLGLGLFYDNLANASTYKYDAKNRLGYVFAHFEYAITNGCPYLSSGWVKLNDSDDVTYPLSHTDNRFSGECKYFDCKKFFAGPKPSAEMQKTTDFNRAMSHAIGSKQAPSHTRVLAPALVSEDDYSLEDFMTEQNSITPYDAGLGMEEFLDTINFEVFPMQVADAPDIDRVLFNMYS